MGTTAAAPEALSMPLDSVRASGEMAAAQRRTQIAAGVLEAGTVAAQRMTVEGDAPLDVDLRFPVTLEQMAGPWRCR